jgi:hypothetical protein
MADGGFSGSGRRTFIIEADAAPDLLLRVLAPFAVQGAVIVAAELAQGAVGASIRIEAAGLTLQRAERVAERLRALPAVTGVGLVWAAGN